MDQRDMTKGRDAVRAVVRVAAAVVDPEPLLTAGICHIPAAAIVGRVRGTAPGVRDGDVLAGVGPLADLIALDLSSVSPVGAVEGLDEAMLALLPVFASTLAALTDVAIGAGHRVLISGTGLTARLAARLIRLQADAPAMLQEVRAGEEGHGPVAPSRADLLIDTTADPARWAETFPLVRDEGRVLLLLPPWPLVCRFDFYPAVHWRSLVVHARRVPRLGGELGGLASATELLRHFRDRRLLEMDDLLLDVAPQRVRAETWAPPDFSGKGWLIRWPAPDV